MSRPEVRVRLFYLSGLVFLIAVTPAARTRSMVGLAALTALSVIAGRVPMRWLGWRLLPFGALLFFGYLGVLFGADPREVLILWVRTVLTAVCALTYCWSTPFTETVAAMAWFRLPGVLIAIAALTYRYVSVLAVEATRMARAYAARRPPRSLVRAAAMGGRLSASLALRTYYRSERVADAMVSRGFDGTFRMLPLPPVSPIDVVAGVSSLGVLVAVWLLG